MKTNLKIMIEIAMITVLALIFGMIKIYEAPFGGSISLVMVPIFLLGFRRGLVPALTAGFLTGFLKVLLGGYVVHPIQLLLDYPLAYLLVGTAGIYKIREDHKKSTLYISLSIILATSLRLLSHFFSGIIWFGQYAPDNMNASLYSFLYNLYYLLPESIISIIIVILLLKKAPALFLLNRQKATIETNTINQ